MRTGLRRARSRRRGRPGGRRAGDCGARRACAAGRHRAHGAGQQPGARRGPGRRCPGAAPGARPWSPPATIARRQDRHSRQRARMRARSPACCGACARAIRICRSCSTRSWPAARATRSAPATRAPAWRALLALATIVAARTSLKRARIGAVRVPRTCSSPAAMAKAAASSTAGTLRRRLVRRWRWPRLPGQFHGSGCTLAAALAGTPGAGRGHARRPRRGPGIYPCRRWRSRSRSPPGSASRAASSTPSFIRTHHARPLSRHPRTGTTPSGCWLPPSAALRGGAVLVQYRHKEAGARACAWSRPRRCWRCAGATAARWSSTTISTCACGSTPTACTWARADAALAQARARARPATRSSAPPATATWRWPTPRSAAGASYARLWRLLSVARQTL